MKTISLYGIKLSPYVRKVNLVLKHKALDFINVPVMPMPDAEKPQAFIDNSPLGKIPLLQVGDDFIPDSSVICAFLERQYPQNALLPAANIEAAKALWFEAYAEGKMVPAISGHLFAELILAKNVFGREPVQAEIDMALNTEIPQIFDYLTTQLKGDYLLGDQFSFADLVVGGQFITLQHCQYQCDASKWPLVAAYIERILSLDIFKSTIEEEQAFLSSVL